MKILKIKNGFTTNSSGSYEWLPLSASSTRAESATNQNINVNQSQFTAYSAKSGQPIDWLILPLSVIAGIIAVSIIIKELAQTIKQNKKNTKRKKNRPVA